jgi:hypothetical protein
MRAVRSGFLVGIAVSALIAVSPASAQADKSVAFDLPLNRYGGPSQSRAEGGLNFLRPLIRCGRRSAPLRNIHD